MRVHFYHPDPAVAPAALAQATELAGRLGRWGHEVKTFVGPAGVNPAVPDVWVVYAAADPLPVLTGTPQLRFLVDPAGIDTLLDAKALDRGAALWNASFYAVVGGSVVDEFRGHPYRRPNHFIYSHPWEAASRTRWLGVGPGDVFLDIGSSIGSWTLPAAACGATVYAFDPGTDAGMLRRLVRENGFGDRAEVIGEFVADAAGRPVSRSAIPWSSVQAEGEFGDTVTTTVDAFVTARGLGRVDLIKVDIDGGEREAIAGMADTLRRFRPPVVIETHTFLGVGVDEVVGLLDGLGYDAVAWPMEEGYYYHVHGLPRGISP